MDSADKKSQYKDEGIRHFLVIHLDQVAIIGCN